MPTLYKFRAVNVNALRVLVRKQIYFAAPQTLNDPLDCQLPISKTIDGLIDRMAGQDARIVAVLRRMSALQQGTGQTLPLHAAFEEFIRTTGVFSVSRTATDMLLWSHYADSHKGFCIGFDDGYFDELRARYLEVGLLGAADVIYADSHLTVLQEMLNAFIWQVGEIQRLGQETDQAVIDRLRDDYRHTIITQFLLLKSSAWKYEKEFRAFTATPRALDFAPTVIREIVFGLRTSALDQDTIRGALVGQEWGHVRFRRAETAWDSLELNLVDC